MKETNKKMVKEKFILVSLKEEESKKLAQIISNDTSRKILDFLAEKDATESEISKKLNVPISTVHYNLQALVKGRLVEAEEFHYSEKGKEVLHYRLANKYVIIAPKSTFGIREKLRRILPVAILGVVGSSMLYVFNTSRQILGSVQEAALDTFEAPKAAARMALVEEADQVVAQGVNIVQDSLWGVFSQNPALWFLFGSIFTLVLIIIVEYIAYKRGR